MITLAWDCLMFEMATGETVPFTAEMISVELSGDSAGSFDPEFVKHATNAVFHYFKHELGRQSITVGEFAGALERVLRGFDFQPEQEPEPEPEAPVKPRVLESDLQQLASESGAGWELFFFLRLRVPGSVTSNLAHRFPSNQSPRRIFFTGYSFSSFKTATSFLAVLDLPPARSCHPLGVFTGLSFSSFRARSSVRVLIPSAFASSVSSLLDRGPASSAVSRNSCATLRMPPALSLSFVAAQRASAVQSERPCHSSFPIPFSETRLKARDAGRVGVRFDLKTARMKRPSLSGSRSINMADRDTARIA